MNILFLQHGKSSYFQYYPAVVMNIMYDAQKCAVMFEGYNTQEIVNFDDIEPYEVCIEDFIFYFVMLK